MAPDLNSVPSSPRPSATIRRGSSHQQSTTVAPPALPSPSQNATNILPSNQAAVNFPTSPTHPTTMLPPPATSMVPPLGDNTGVGAGPGPLRHPRPLTAADLHLQLEKEQEAVVNRLTRELSMLRAAQNASVVSNASSTSAGVPETDSNSTHLLSGPSHSTPSQRRHHRSSSAASSRSMTMAAGGSGWTIPTSMGNPTMIPDRTRSSTNTSRQGQDPSQPSRSRTNSISSIRQSGASSPAPSFPSSAQSSYQHPDHFSYFYHQQRERGNLPPREPSFSSTDVHAGMGASSTSALTPQSSGGPTTSVSTTGRYEETALHRAELDAVKRENEALRRRIRELERTLRTRRQSDASRTRSTSVSTTASVRGSSITLSRGRDEDHDEYSSSLPASGAP